MILETEFFFACCKIRSVPFSCGEIRSFSSPLNESGNGPATCNIASQPQIESFHPSSLFKSV